MKYLGDPKSGSQANTTASRNRFGQYYRTRAVPVNPSSTAQQAARARLQLNSAGWRLLTSAQRQGWNDLGAQMTRQDPLGQTVTLTGFMAYMSVNNNNLAAGNAVVADAPLFALPYPVATVTVTLAAATFSVAWTATPLAAGQRIFVWASPQRSAGRTFENDFRLIFVGAAASASPANILSNYTARFGVPVTGARIFNSVQVYSGGFLSSPILTSSVVS